jgi:hypothetical protein
MSQSYGNARYGQQATAIAVTAAATVAANAMTLANSFSSQLTNVEASLAAAIVTINNTGTMVAEETSRAESVETILQQDINNIVLSSGGIVTLPYTIPFSCFDPIMVTSILDGTIVTEQVTLPVNLTGSFGKCGIAPVTSNSQFDILINGTTVGEVLFSPGSTNATFTFAAQQVLNPGDLIILQVSSGVFDTSLENVFITLTGTYTSA